MIIGFDIDGILTKDGCGLEYNNNNKKIWKCFFENYLNRRLIRINNSYNFSKAYGFPEQKMFDFFNKEMVRVIPKFKINKDMQKLNNIVFSEDPNNRVYIITARENNEEIKKETINWLKKNKIKYDNIFFTKEKGKKAKELNIEFFFEDNIENANDLKTNGVKVFMLGKYHNQPQNHIDHPAFKFNNNSYDLMWDFLEIYQESKN